MPLHYVVKRIHKDIDKTSLKITKTCRTNLWFSSTNGKKTQYLAKKFLAVTNAKKILFTFYAHHFLWLIYRFFFFIFFSVSNFVASAALKQHRNIIGLQSVAYKGFVLLLSFLKNPAIPNLLILLKKVPLEASFMYFSHSPLSVHAAAYKWDWKKWIQRRIKIHSSGI